MLKDDNYIKGDPLAICDLCSLQFHASELKKMWNGLYACKDDWEPRPEYETPNKPSKPRKLPFTRPEGNDKFMTVAERNPDLL
ncbi:MAG: hypothetical protein WC332_02100 [Clostridia bacterium]|jgi:hypothetical protein